jgi:hypothetical protein
MDEPSFRPLTKASIGRTMQHTRHSQFGILTSWSEAASSQENSASFDRLRNQIRSMGYGHFPLQAHWKGPTGIEHEPSLFVPGLTLEHAKALGRAHSQEAVLHGTPDAVALHFGDGSQTDLGEFDPTKLADAYSMVKGRDFTFIGFSELPGNFVEALAERVRTQHARDARSQRTAT